jgi:hypothetical protein
METFFKQTSKPKRRKPSPTKLKKKLDTVFSLWIKNRDNWTCITCGKFSRDPQKMNAGHYISRRHHSVRWNEKNVNAQCAGCNCFRGGNLDVYALRLQEKYGDGILKELNQLKNQVRRWGRAELEKLIKKYEVSWEVATPARLEE